MHKNIIINHVHHITQNVILLKMYSFLSKEDCKKGTQNDVFKDLNQIFFYFRIKLVENLRPSTKLIKHQYICRSKLT